MITVPQICPHIPNKDSYMTAFYPDWDHELDIDNDYVEFTTREIVEIRCEMVDHKEDGIGPEIKFLLGEAKTTVGESYPLGINTKEFINLITKTGCLTVFGMDNFIDEIAIDSEGDETEIVLTTKDMEVIGIVGGYPEP